MSSIEGLDTNCVLRVLIYSCWCWRGLNGRLWDPEQMRLGVEDEVIQADEVGFAEHEVEVFERACHKVGL